MVLQNVKNVSTTQAFKTGHKLCQLAYFKILLLLLLIIILITITILIITTIIIIIIIMIIITEFIHDV